MSKQNLKTAVVGCGMAGMTAASRLLEAGHNVVCFDKAKGVGGRMSVRRQDGFEFDHGAQYFTARDAGFAEQVRAWIGVEVVAEWEARVVNLGPAGTTPREFQTRYVGVPGMHGPIKRMAQGVDIRFSTLVGCVKRQEQQWQLTSDKGDDLGRYDRLIVNLPPAQARVLLAGETDLLNAITPAGMDPCWAVMAGFEELVTTEFDAAFVNDSPLSWIARNNSKPQRSKKEAWVLHASPEWSTTHLESPPDAVAQELLDWFSRLTSTSAKPSYLSAHRWRYARAASSLSAGAIADVSRGVAICGDWCAGSRIESAFLSGVAAAESIE